MKGDTANSPKCVECGIDKLDVPYVTDHGCRNRKAHRFSDNTRSCRFAIDECKICREDPRFTNAGRTRTANFESLNEEVTGTRPAPVPVGHRPWFRVVDYAGPDTEWQPALALQLQGDGPFLRNDDDGIMVFRDGDSLITWAMSNAAFIIGLEPRS